VATKARKATRTTQPRAPLSRMRVLEAALRVVDDEGLDALTMRRLGEELQADPMSVYRHVDGKDALFDGLAETMWAEVPGPPGQAWPDDLRTLARSVRGVIHRHHGAAPLVIRRFLNRSALEVSHAYLEVLRRAGFRDSRAAEVLRSVVSYSVGYGLQEISLLAVPGTPVQGEGAGREFLVALGQSLPAGTPPHLIETAIALCADCDPDACFEFGLELIVQGVRQLETAEARDRVSC